MLYRKRKITAIGGYRFGVYGTIATPSSGVYAVGERYWRCDKNPPNIIPLSGTLGGLAITFYAIDTVQLLSQQENVFISKKQGMGALIIVDLELCRGAASTQS